MSWIVVLGQSMHFIQAWKIFTTKSAEDVSIISYIICLLLVIHWLGYGIIINDRILIIAEGIGIIGAILVIVGILIYS